MNKSTGRGGASDERKIGECALPIGEQIAGRYVITKSLGSGTFGQVVQAYDCITRESVAIKIIKERQDFRNLAHNEITVLERLNELDPTNVELVVKMKASFEWNGRICIVFELLSYNLYELIKRADFKGVSLELTRRIGDYLAHALCFLSTARIVHCDLKPENIAFCDSGHSKLKLIDFGSALVNGGRRFKYVQSRFYRSPEVMLGYTYGPAIDMWSVGCILFELHTGRPLFQGQNEIEQMMQIIEVVGMPSDKILDSCPGTKRFFKNQSGGGYVPVVSKNGSLVPKSVSLENLVDAATGAYGFRLGMGGYDYRMFLDLLKRMLEIDPAQRITPWDMLRHPFITKTSALSPAIYQQHGTPAYVARNSSAYPYSLNNNSYQKSCPDMARNYATLNQIYPSNPWASTYRPQPQVTYNQRRGRHELMMRPAVSVPKKYTHPIVSNKKPLY